MTVLQVRSYYGITEMILCMENDNDYSYYGIE